MPDRAGDEIDLRTATGAEVSRAIARGVREALIEHKRAGVPAVVWEDGRIVLILPEQIEIPEEDAEEAEGP